MRLVVIEMPGLGSNSNQAYNFELKSDPARPIWYIGRQMGSDIHLIDPSVSRRHAEVSIQSEGLLVRDLGSANGTFINDHALAAQAQSLVRPGDRLRIGNVVTLLEAGSLASADIPLQNVAPPMLPVYQNWSAPPPPKGFSLKNIPTVTYVIAPLVLLAIVLLFSFLMLLRPNASTSLIELPSAIFNSPANRNEALGLNISHPSAWQRTDVGDSQVIFYQAENSTTVFNIERAPSRTIADANLSPDAALSQYTINVKANSSALQTVRQVSPTKLKDGTPAVLTRLIFSTEQLPVVLNYNLSALAFRCGDTLYFVSAAAEARNYNAATKQDLDAAIANVACGNN